MKNKNLFYLLLLLVLGGLAIWLSQNQKPTTLDQQETDFSIQDTGRIDKIFLADKNGNEVELTREAPGRWILNDNRLAAPPKVRMLLETIFHVEVKGPMPQKARETVIKNMAANSVKAEFYEDGQLIKTLYVGGTTPDNLGTFMFLEGAQNPYITHIPGFNGYLTIRFSPNPREWRSKQLFRFNPVSIASVQLRFPRGGTPGYELHKRGEDDFRLIQTGAGTETAADPIAAKRYLVHLAEMNVNSYVRSTVVDADSLRQQLPRAELRIELASGDQHGLRIYPKKPDRRTKGTTEDGFDIDYYWAIKAENPAEVLVLSKKTLGRTLPHPDRLREGS